MGHIASVDFPKSSVDELAKMHPGAIQQLGRNPIHLLFAKPIADPLLKQSSVLAWDPQPPPQTGASPRIVTRYPDRVAGQ